MKKWRQYGWGLLGFLVLFGIDQWTKWLAYMTLRGRGEVPVWGDVFVLQYLENRGAAFGILQNQRIFLILLTVIILAALVFVYHKIPAGKKFHVLRGLDVLLAAGAVGNLADRLFRGYVIDFFYFKWIHFPIFNVADCYVVIAAIVSVLLIGFYYQEDDFVVRSDQK